MKAKVRLFLDKTPSQITSFVATSTEELTFFFNNDEELDNDDVEAAVQAYAHAKKLLLYKFDVLEISN